MTSQTDESVQFEVRDLVSCEPYSDVTIIGWEDPNDPASFGGVVSEAAIEAWMSMTHKGKMGLFDYVAELELQSWVAPILRGLRGHSAGPNDDTARLILAMWVQARADAGLPALASTQHDD